RVDPLDGVLDLGHQVQPVVRDGQLLLAFEGLGAGVRLVVPGAVPAVVLHVVEFGDRLVVLGAELAELGLQLAADLGQLAGTPVSAGWYRWGSGLGHSAGLSCARPFRDQRGSDWRSGFGGGARTAGPPRCPTGGRRPGGRPRLVGFGSAGGGPAGPGSG